jgi:hypothetical protein
MHLRKSKRPRQHGGLDRAVMPFFGPAQVGPYETEPPVVVDGTCPTCGRLDSEHVIDRSSGRSRIQCPTE